MIGTLFLAISNARMTKLYNKVTWHVTHKVFLRSCVHLQTQSPDIFVELAKITPMGHYVVAQIGVVES